DRGEREPRLCRKVEAASNVWRDGRCPSSRIRQSWTTGGRPSKSDPIGPVGIRRADLIFRSDLSSSRRLVLDLRNRGGWGANIGGLSRIGFSGGMKFIGELVFRFLEFLDG